MVLSSVPYDLSFGRISSCCRVTIALQRSIDTILMITYMSVKALPPLFSDAVKTSVGSMMFFVCECVLALVLILGLKVAVNSKNKWTLSL